MSVAANELGAAPARPSRLALFWESSIGKKALMALTGIILAAYVVAHLLGNMQIYMGADSAGRAMIDKYAEFLHSNQGVLWTARIVLLLAIGVHAVSGIQLYMRKAAARPVDYHTRANIQGSTASRTMLVTGVVILLFVVYHVLHLTTGTVHPAFQDLRPYHNVTAGFRQPVAAVIYIVSMIGVGFHLWHGLYSMFGSLGFSHPRYTPTIQKAAALVATVIALGNISVPVAVLTGLLGK
jgi:succinate dehydrogenase / fumarate reductase cytochrome b subunit